MCHFILEVLRAFNSCMNWVSAEAQSILNTSLCEPVWKEPVGTYGCVWGSSHQKTAGQGERKCGLGRVWTCCTFVLNLWELKTQDTQSCLAVSKATPHSGHHHEGAKTIYVPDVRMQPCRGCSDIHPEAVAHQDDFPLLLGLPAWAGGCKNWVYCLNKCLLLKVAVWIP